MKDYVNVKPKKRTNKYLQLAKHIMLMFVSAYILFWLALGAL